MGEKQAKSRGTAWSSEAVTKRFLLGIFPGTAVSHHYLKTLGWSRNEYFSSTEAELPLFEKIADIMVLQLGHKRLYLYVSVNDVLIWKYFNAGWNVLDASEYSQFDCRLFSGTAILVPQLLHCIMLELCFFPSSCLSEIDSCIVLVVETAMRGGRLPLKSDSLILFFRWQCCYENGWNHIIEDTRCVPLQTRSWKSCFC